MNPPQTYDADFRHQIGHYSDAIRVPAGYDQIAVSGTPGLVGAGGCRRQQADKHPASRVTTWRLGRF
jgi:hypothetical protein